MIVDTLQEFLFNTDLENSILMQSDYLVYGIVMAYIIFVKFLGPLIMKQRKALDLYYFVILFNVILVVWNSYLCFMAVTFAQKFWHNRCYLKYSPDVKTNLKEFGYLAWQGVFIKLLELIDTVIFILRKKFNQVTFLHVFHHSIVVVMFWTVLKRKEIAYFVLLAAAINCGVHVVMYSYYCLSAIGPSVRKYLWWKKYLTVIQLLQFFIVLLYLAYSFLTDCEEFAGIEKICFGVAIAFVVLFLNFYFKAYYQQN